MTRVDASATYAAATDPDRVQALIEEHLIQPAAGNATVSRCHVEFARRGNARNLFQYKIGLAGTDGEIDREEIVTAVAYGGARTRKAWDKIQRRRKPVAVGGLVPAAYVPELDLLLQVFPFDYEMPALESLLAGPWSPLLSLLLPTFGEGDWRAEAWEAETIRYRVDLRATVRLHLHAADAATGRSASKLFFIKTYANGDVASRAWDIQTLLDQHLGRSRRGSAIAPAVGFLATEKAIAWEEATGLPLTEALQRPGHATNAAQQAARALAEIHQLAIEAPAQRHELERSGGDRLSRNADRLRALRPDLMATIDRVEAGILDGFAAIGEAPGAPIHGDLKPAHVLLTEDASTFLDLDKFAVGEPMLDVTSLARHILRGRSTNPGLTPQDLAAAFVTEYFAHSPSDWQTRFGPHYAATLIGEASAAGRSVRGNREHAAGKPRARPTKDVERLLEEALEALSGQAPWAASISDADADAAPPLTSAAAVEPGAASPDAQSAGGGDRGAAGAARQSGAGKRRAANAAIFAHLADSPDIASLFAAYPDLTLDDLRSVFGEAEALTRQSRTINFRKGVTQTSFTRTHGLPEPDLSVHKGNVFRALISLLKPGRMLDLGAGKGNFSLSAAELGWRVTAVDARTVRWPDLNAESDPERAALLQSIRWVQADVREFPIARGDFDLICILGLLHHLEVADQVELLKRCSGAPLLLDTRIAKSNVDHVDGYEGMLIQEHGQTREERDAVPQASWGNPVSFQHTEESLTKLVQDCGYMKIFQMRPPHRPDYTFYLCLPSGMDRKRLDRRAERRALREEGKSGYAPTDPRSAGLSGSGEPAPKGKRRRKSAES